MLNEWGKASVVMAALVMSACARAPVSQQEPEVKTFRLVKFPSVFSDSNLKAYLSQHGFVFA